MQSDHKPAKKTNGVELLLADVEQHCKNDKYLLKDQFSKLFQIEFFSPVHTPELQFVFA
jgi:hypothetical protein